MNEEGIVARSMEVLAKVGLEKDATKVPSEISGGMRKRAGLARAIVRNPAIVLYDEPTSGLDPVTARTIDSLIGELQRDMGVTSVVVTHDLHSALSIGNRIAMLSGGRIVELADPQAFLKSPTEEVQAFLWSQFITRKGAWEQDKS
jgi:phospholipid/cholesterol/gamma-HCH transport system ATP-binding protein